MVAICNKYAERQLTHAGAAEKRWRDLLPQLTLALQGLNGKPGVKAGGAAGARWAEGALRQGEGAEEEGAAASGGAACGDEGPSTV